MSTKNALSVLGAGLLGVVVGLQFGSFTADPGSPVTSFKEPWTPPVPQTGASPTIDVERLAGQIGKTLGEQFRTAIQEELASVLRVPEPGEVSGERDRFELRTVSEEERESRRVAFVDALRVVEDARLHGRFGSDSHDDLLSLMDLIGPDEQFEVTRQLFAALSEGTIEIDDPEDLFF